MLQQTQVATVWSYYKTWMQHFPDLPSLAGAELDTVLKTWEGLGYYSRARNLHRGARVVLNQWEGKLPETIQDLQKIPGIGPYTAAAICSLAFGQATPLIDGNVLRVISRLMRLAQDVSRPGTRQMIQERLLKMIPVQDPGAFNQALMDLGRVICTPGDPDCKVCPLAAQCLARAAGDMADFPVKSPKAPVPHYTIVIGLIRKDGQILIQKRPEQGLLGGLWEFPGGKVEAEESLEAALSREISEETGLTVVIGERIATIKHAYTHFKITMTAFFCDWQTGHPQTHAASENRWVDMPELKQFAFPRANLKILEKLPR